MAVSSQDIVNFLLANPGMSDAQIVSAMEQYGVSPAQMASAVGLDEGVVAARVAATVPQGQSVTLGDTVIVPQYQTTSSGMDQQVGALESFAVSKSNGDPNYKAPVGTPMQIYNANGEFVDTVRIKKDQSFFGGLVDALKDPVVQAAVLGVAGGAGAFDGLFGGAGAAAGAEGLTLSELGLGGNNLAAATNVADVVAGTEGGLLTGGSDVVGMGAGTGLKVGATGLDTITAGNAGLNSGLTTGANTGLLTTAGTTLAGIDTGVTAANAAATAKAAADAAAAAKLASQSGLITGALKTAGGLLQTEEDKAAAQLAAQNVNKATQQAVEASQFRPVGMTTRFGTSNYTYDPVTGRMTSAGYQLSPEAKNAQDRLVGLAGRGLTQAEQAQQQFAPLQTGAQNLFGLGNQYISQSPQDVAQNYINQQMQLLQPSREMDLANLQNRLYQQGRTGVSVAQGGSLGATTPELQALYNARAMQDLQLSSQAQQAGQQNVLFGAGLLGQGATAMGNYYGGQQAAYSPFTTALGQVQNLETQAQQPLTMGANLAQQASTAGFNAGRLGLQGTTAAADLTTGKAATTNPYASLLSGIDPAFAAGIAKQIWGA
jgi:hypothetical protein